MPGKYEIEAVYSLTTSLEPEGVLRGVEDSVEDYEDSSSWDTGSITAEGGVVTFTVQADSEDEARDIAQLALNNAHYGDDSIEWEIEDYSISDITCIEEPWDMDRALTVVRAFITRMREMGGVTREEEEAISFLLDSLTP
jgi:hypothetical protein